jgi:predicted dehydrogenase
MITNRKLHIAVVGLGFGADFVPIYRDHPNVASVIICDKDEKRLQSVASRFGIDRYVRDVEDIVAAPDIDAVHLCTGIPSHAAQTVAMLRSGKHCACAVPMATSLDDLHTIVAAQRQSGLNYMMMETGVYTRQFLYAKALRDQGDFGRIQFLRGAYYQDHDNLPPYWAGMPPMWYATHVVGPMLAIAETRAVKVHCFGSGVMREELRHQYANPWPVETSIFQLDKPNLSAEVTRTMFHCARPYMESFTVYGENACYEWQMEDEPPLLFRATPVVVGQVRQFSAERPVPPDRADLLPSEIGKYTQRFLYTDSQRNLSFEVGGGHHGSHPHLVHEFVRSIVEHRLPWLDAVRSADITAAGICAHTSAMHEGTEVSVPDFA